MKKIITLVKIEGKLAIRGIDSVFFGIGMPMGIAILIGMICGGKPSQSGGTYTFLEESFGALITVGICATAFMGIPLGLSDYRDKKVLKHYYATPVSPAILLAAHVIVNMLLAFASSIAVYLTMLLCFGYRMRGSLLAFVAIYLLVMASMYGIGMLMASLCKNIKIANLVCTLVYFPMLFLSGATIPYEIFPRPIQTVANVLPLTQGIKLLKGASLGLPLDNLFPPLCVIIIVAILGIGGSIRTFRFE